MESDFQIQRRMYSYSIADDEKSPSRDKNPPSKVNFGTYAPPNPFKAREEKTHDYPNLESNIVPTIQ